MPKFLTLILSILIISPLFGVKTHIVIKGNLSLKIPDSWKEIPPHNRMRLAQFVIPKMHSDSEDCEMTVFYFAEGGSMNHDGNIRRWESQFEDRQPTIKSEGRSSQGKYILAEIRGTYLKDPTPMDDEVDDTEYKENFLMLAVILMTENGNYYLKFYGPEKTVKKEKANFINTFK